MLFDLDDAVLSGASYGESYTAIITA